MRQQEMDAGAAAIVAEDTEVMALISAEPSCLSHEHQLRLARQTWAGRQDGATVADALSELAAIFTHADPSHYSIVMLWEACHRLRGKAPRISPAKVAKMQALAEAIRAGRKAANE